MAILSFSNLRQKLNKTTTFKSIVVCATVIAGALGTFSCDPAADHVLTSEDKAADMYWLFSIFRNNYAPLEYKESRNSFDVDKLQKSYLTKAKKTKSNDEFYRLMAQYVAEFKDAHTGGSITPASLPGQATIAYLGISGVRDGKDFRVTDILPTIDRANFPIAVGDKITEVDGISVFEYIDRNLVPYRNFGNDLANKTIHMSSLFTRMSLTMPIPEKDDVKLTVQSGKTKKQVSLPWIKRDLYDFKLERALINASRQGKVNALTVTDPNTSQQLSFSVLDQRGIPMSISDLMDTYQGKSSKNFLETFKLSTPSAISLTKRADDPLNPPSGMEALKKERSIPDNAISIEDAKAFPAYMYTVDIKDAAGKVRGKKRVGYVRIAAFELDVPISEDDAVKELRTTLKKFKSFGINNVVVDTIDNPGGSLSLLAKVSQAFSDKPIHQPDMRFGLNDNWLLEIQQNALNLSGSDEQRERARRLYEKLRAEKNEGKRLSSVYNVADIVTDKIEPNVGVHFDKIVVLVNEMNASCGDIFPATLQDNGIAIIAGTNTMGAGGNVVSHQNDQAPNGHFTVRQTESLIVRKDGTYLENNGVKPDIEFDVNAGLAGKYDSARQKANEIILDKNAAPKALLEKRKAAEESKSRSEDADERASRRQGELLETDSRAKSDDVKAIEKAVRAGETR